MTVEYAIAHAIGEIDTVFDVTLRDSELRPLGLGATPEEAEACLHNYREAWAEVRRQAIQTIWAVLETRHAVQ